MRAASALCKPKQCIFMNLLKQKYRHFDEIFIIDCTGRQLPVHWWKFHQNDNISVASWIILTFRADLVHVYITRCGHVYSYKKKFTIHVLYVGLYHLIFSMYPYFEFTCQIYIIWKQPSFIIITPTGIWDVKWTFILYFRISINGNTDFVKSLWYQ